MQPTGQTKHKSAGKAIKWKLPKNSKTHAQNSDSPKARQRKRGVSTSEHSKPGNKARGRRADSPSSSSKQSLKQRGNQPMQSLQGKLDAVLKGQLVNCLMLWGWPLNNFVRLAVLEWLKRHGWRVKRELADCKIRLSESAYREIDRRWRAGGEAMQNYFAAKARRAS